MQNRKLGYLQFVTVALVIVILGIVHAKYIGHYEYFTEPRFEWEVCYIAISEFFIYILKPKSGSTRIFTNFTYVLMAPILSALAISVFQLVVGTPLLPRFLIVASLATTFLGLLSIWLYSVRFQKNFLIDKVLFLGEVIESENLNFNQHEKEKPFDIIDVLPKTSTFDQIMRVFADTRFNVMVMDRHSQSQEEHVKAATKLHSQGVRIRTLTLFFDEWLGKMPLGELEQISLLFDIAENVSPTYMRVRRIVDILVSILLTFVFMILVPIVFVLNLFGNRGPLLYSQLRVGKDNKPFRIYKFRTMSLSVNDDELNQWTQMEDSRVTVIGKLLRILHIDEIPQVINILKGEMTLVGPRPEQLKYVEQLTNEIPFYQMRHIVTPGITGWAQVKFHYGASVDDTLQKIQYEFYYIRHQSLILDIKVVARTLQILWRGIGR